MLAVVDQYDQNTPGKAKKLGRGYIVMGLLYMKFERVKVKRFSRESS